MRPCDAHQDDAVDRRRIGGAASVLLRAELSGKGGTYTLVEDPLHSAASLLSPAFYSGEFPDALAARIDIRIMAATA